jgi:hypothetical protein
MAYPSPGPDYGKHRGSLFSNFFSLFSKDEVFHYTESLAYLAFSIYFIKRGYDTLPTDRQPTVFEKLITSSTGKGLSWTLFATSLIYFPDSEAKGFSYYYRKTSLHLQRLIFATLLSAWIIGSQN